MPIAVHLDHATTDEDIDTSLRFAEAGVAFDSIMVDASHAETDEENLAIVRPSPVSFLGLALELTWPPPFPRPQSKVHIDRATKVGVAVEVELGRLEGGEAGLRVISDSQLTNADKAEMFMTNSGATLLAPSIGNLHGEYMSPPEDQFKLDLCVCARSLLSPGPSSAPALTLLPRPRTQSRDAPRHRQAQRPLHCPPRHRRPARQALDRLRQGRRAQVQHQLVGARASLPSHLLALVSFPR